ncbi:uncharacterized protein LOC113763518 [Coffea eugenioides]|uniref:uncharacterized protein LOC113763518 n=1 Tax=Coffea eugenioides TaxID=49369 RepID=UPI000F61373E|nr:uncharacterized protein LOC113763518 [Coffea eugenioides]
MDISEKLSEAMKLNEEKKNRVQALMYLATSEWKEYDGHLLQMQNCFEECFNGLESKQEKLKVVQESVSQSMTKLDVRRVWVEQMFKELGKKEKLMKELLQRMEEKEMLLGKYKDFVDEKIKDLALKEGHFQGLFGELRLFQNQMERRKNEIDEKEKRLEKRKEELEVREEILELKLKLVSIRGCDEEEKAGDNAPYNHPPLKRCGNLAWGSGKILDADEEVMNLEEESSHRSKRSCIDGKNAGQVTADDLGKSGLGDIDVKEVMAKAFCTQNIIVIDDSDSDTDSKDNIVSNPINSPGSFYDDIEKEKLVSRFKYGQTWACYDGKDIIPRAYAQIMTVFQSGGIIRLGVAWLKPLWGFPGENKWINAGLPVGCGMFERERTSVEAATVFSHQVCCLEKVHNRYCVLPGAGETWAIYKDWDIFAWACDPENHRQCKYEIVEVLEYQTSGSSLFDIRVACLDKMGGSLNSFQRRRQDEDGSFLIRSSNLYRFSHKVPSVRKACNVPGDVSDVTFDIEPESMPPGL